MRDKEEATSQLDNDLAELFDVLTNPKKRCTSRADIARYTKWSKPKVGYLLWKIRNPQTAAEWGWTVPHVPRGQGKHLYQVVLADVQQKFTDGEIDHVHLGSASTLSYMATSGYNQGHALRQMALQLPPAVRREMNRAAVAFEGAAAMAEDMYERINNKIHKNEKVA